MGFFDSIWPLRFPVPQLLPPRPPPTASSTRPASALFAYGYSALTMDELAHELGMSKKTLYVHFSGKDAIIDAIVEEIGQVIRDRMDTVLSDPELNFTQKMCALIDVVGSNLAKASPGMLHDLQRFAPHLYQKIDDLRSRNAPSAFGRLIRTGLAEGKVRPEIDPDFAVEFWLQAIRGLMHPQFWNARN